MAQLPSPDEVNLPGRVLFRSGVSTQIAGAALRLGEGALTSDNWWGWLGDESQNPPHWPTSKTTGTWDSTNLDYSFTNLNTQKINGQFLKDLFSSFITSGATPVITIINDVLTKTVYGPGADFADLQAAYAWLSQRTISTLGSVTLVFPGIKITETKAYVINHPNGDRIFWKGADLKTALPAPSTYQKTGPSPAQQAGDTVVNLALLRQSFATELYFTNGGCLGFTGNLARMSNILVTSDGALGSASLVIGMTVSNCTASFQNVAVVGFDLYGVQIANGSAAFLYPGSQFITLGNGGGGLSVATNALFAGTDATTVSISNGGKHATNFPSAGIQIDGNSLFACYPYYTSTLGNVVYVACNSNGGVSLNTSVFAGSMVLTSNSNGGNGVGLSAGSRVNVGGATILSNQANGVAADGLSNASIVNSTVSNNAAGGIVASNGAIINRAGSTVSGNATNFSPALGSTGNNNALIV